MSAPARAVRDWVEDFVIRLGLCPFAARPFRDGLVDFPVCPEHEAEPAFDWTVTQLQAFITVPRPPAATWLLIYPEALFDFAEFLDFLAAAEELCEASGADALVQFAHFHPAYRFADVPEEDPANATNRSPYPVLQLLLVEGVAEAVRSYPDVEAIPARNVALLRGLG